MCVQTAYSGTQNTHVPAELPPVLRPDSYERPSVAVGEENSHRVESRKALESWGSQTDVAVADRKETYTYASGLKISVK